MLVPVRFRTNLDLSRFEKWPDALPYRPMVGDLVRSSHTWMRERGKEGAMQTFQLELEVVRVTITSSGIIEAELTLPKNRYESMRVFYENVYEPITGMKFV